jgi:hypothetical protein
MRKQVDRKKKSRYKTGVENVNSLVPLTSLNSAVLLSILIQVVHSSLRIELASQAQLHAHISRH